MHFMVIVLHSEPYEQKQAGTAFSAPFPSSPGRRFSDA